MSCCGGGSKDETEVDLSESFNRSMQMYESSNSMQTSMTSMSAVPEVSQPRNWSTVLTTERITMANDNATDGDLKNVICELVDRMQESCRDAIQGNTWNDLYVTDWDWTTQDVDNASDEEDWPSVEEGLHLSKQRITIGWGPQAPPPSWLEEDEEDGEGGDKNLIILATLAFYHASEEALTEDDFIYSHEDYDEEDYPLSRVISIVAEYQTMVTDSSTDDTMPPPITTTLKFTDPSPLHTYSTILLQSNFLLWRKPVVASSSTTHAILLLDPSLAGQIYVSGRLSNNKEMGNALFGLDWSGSGDLKEVYGTLWQELVVDATISSLDANRRLLHRLLFAVEDDVIWDEDAPVIDLATSTSVVESFESTVLSSPSYDSVGIAAKALATSFQTEFGPLAFPIKSSSEVERMNYFFPKAQPLVIIPENVFSVLARGGFSPWYTMMTWYWKTNSEKACCVPMEIAEAAKELSLNVQMVIVDTKYISTPCCCLGEGVVHVDVNASVDDWKQAMIKAQDDYVNILKDYA